jgi:transposase-like protein
MSDIRNYVLLFVYLIKKVKRPGACAHSWKMSGASYRLDETYVKVGAEWK